MSTGSLRRHRERVRQYIARSIEETVNKPKEVVVATASEIRSTEKNFANPKTVQKVGKAT